MVFYLINYQYHLVFPKGGHLSPLLFALFILDIGACFKYCKYQLFADDLKIYANVVTIYDHRKIQDDLNQFCDWCQLNGLKLNTTKCFKMSFSRSRTKLFNDYHLFGNHIEDISIIKDLGVVFKTDLSFKSHVDHICTKSLRTLGFLIRNTKEFRNEQCLKTLYISLVRPTLEYCSIIWNPSQVGLMESLERVQRRFLRLIAFKRRMHSINHPSESISLNSIQDSLKLYPLVNRRKYTDICFLFKLINGVISCPELLQFINFHVLRFNSRSYPTFKIPFHRTSYGTYNPTDRIARECNNLKLDPFVMNNLYSLKHCF